MSAAKVADPFLKLRHNDTLEEMPDPPRQSMPGGPVRFGPYFLESRIAVGGTAEVYLARPVDPRAEPQRLVVKRLLPHFVGDPEGRTMFEREAALHASVEHENVVSVFGAGSSDEGEPYLAMEYIDGCDAYRLLRRLQQEGQLLGVPSSVFITCEALRALASVHGATDVKGTPLGIIHRDVTPSNLYLSREGVVKLGDFGIARSTTRHTLRSEQSAVLKGKFAYLAPEQVAGEPFDHRADLFSLASVFAEMLLGKPLFPGGGQLAVLLAIRDCRLDNLAEIKPRLPAGLYDILAKALSRDPARRFQNAMSFAAALEAFEPEEHAARTELAVRVAWVQQNPSTDAMKAVRASVASMRAVVVRPEVEVDEDDSNAFERKTGEYSQLPSFVETAAGTRHGPWAFARLVEALATGTIGRGDNIDYMGRGMAAVEQIPDLVRFLQPITATTNKLKGPGAPDFADELSSSSMLATLLRVLEQRETGVLFAERISNEEGEGARKELYFVEGKLHHVASSNASELLGEYLVRRGKLQRDELDLALAVLPRYSGRIGDTLISLGLVGPVDIFRAIREQGRDRVADLFLWRQGKISFYRGQTAPHVEFPLDLDLPTLMLAGVEAATPTDTPLEKYRDRLDDTVIPTKDRRLQSIGWPPMVTRVLAVCSAPRTVRELLKTAARGGSTSAADVLRAMEILLAAKLIAWPE